MRLYNTKSRQIEDFKPLSSRVVKVYTCGPTVYNYAHIGNLRAYIFSDIVVRTLRFLGYNVDYMMNITDVEDKTIRDSQIAGESLKDFTEKYTKLFLEDIKKLNIVKPDKVVPITTLIPEMVRMINTLLKRGNAYLGEDGSIYFDIKTFKKYGEFANLDMKNLKAGARVNSDEYDKESASDFVLWKAWKESDGENFWEEEFEVKGGLADNNKQIISDNNDSISGKYSELHKVKQKNLLTSSENTLGQSFKIKLKGRPGWHIECSACNMKYFGQQIDIHMGGIDLIFPHHQNEIAQTESCTNKEFSKYWLHSGHLMVDGKKMAKSAGNFYRLIDLEERYLSGKLKVESGKNITPSILYRAIRLGYINAKYASELDFTFDKIDSNISVIKSIDETIKSLQRVIKNKNYGQLNNPDTNHLCHSDEGQNQLNVKNPLFGKPTIKEDNVVGISKEFSDKMQDFINDYISALEDNFNTPEALAIFHKFLSFVNIGLRNEKFSIGELESITDMFKTFNEVFAIIDFDVFKDEEIPKNILKKFEKRNKAKSEGDFAKADKIREEILSLGYRIVDDRGGSYLDGRGYAFE